MPLCVSRKVDESIKIGDDIEVIVREIRGDKVRLVVVAPPDVPIDRHEIWEAKKANPVIDGH